MTELQRTSSLVLVTSSGTLLGCLPALPIAKPWWQEVEPVVEAFRVRHGITVTILRLLEAERDEPHGGHVTYLAEVRVPVAAEPWAGVLEDHSLRLSYAKPGGPRADLDWAETALIARGLRLAGAPVQVRTWNLSSLWRIPVVGGGRAWLKVTPPFLAPEGALLERLQGATVPRLLGRDHSRILLAEIPGEDLYDAEAPVLRAMIARLVEIQRDWIGHGDDLLGLGLPDWRAPALDAAIAAAFERTADALSDVERGGLARFVRDLPARFAHLAACGLPDTLIHGDFHPGNFRGDSAGLVLLDWADSGVGHPLLDQSAFLSQVAPEEVAELQTHWSGAWRAHIPGCDPERAAQLIAPIVAARRAAVYLRFLDAIEPSEHAYHRSDPVDWMQRTAAILCGEDE